MSSLRVAFLVLVVTLLIQARGISSKNVGEIGVFNSYPLKFNVLIDRKRLGRLLAIRGGNNEEDPSNRSNRELVLGKDRELVHFSVDLMLVWSKLTDKSTYIDFMRSSWRGIRNFAGVVDSENEFKAIAIEILRDIRLTNSGSCIKLFQGNMKLAEWLATNTGRFVLIYIEDGNIKTPSSSSVKYRYSLGDSNLGKYINDEVHFAYFKSIIYYSSILFGPLQLRPNLPIVCILLRIN